MLEWLKIRWAKDKDECMMYAILGALGTALVWLLYEAFWWAIGGKG